MQIQQMSKLVACLMVCIGFATPSAYAQTPNSTWDFEETNSQPFTMAEDSTSVFNGSVIDGGNYTRGKFGTEWAMYFNAANIAVHVPSIDLGDRDSLTVAAWFRTKSKREKYQTIVSKWFSGSDKNGGSFTLTAACHGLAFQIQDEDSEFFGISEIPLAGADPDFCNKCDIPEHKNDENCKNQEPRDFPWDGWFASNDGNWHLAVGTFDGSSIALYMDGVLQGSQTFAADKKMEDSGQEFFIGTDNRYLSSNPASDRFFSGHIAHVVTTSQVWTQEMASEAYTDGIAAFQWAAPALSEWADNFDILDNYMPGFRCKKPENWNKLSDESRAVCNSDINILGETFSYSVEPAKSAHVGVPRVAFFTNVVSGTRADDPDLYCSGGTTQDLRQSLNYPDLKPFNDASVQSALESCFELFFIPPERKKILDSQGVTGNGNEGPSIGDLVAVIKNKFNIDKTGTLRGSIIQPPMDGISNPTVCALECQKLNSADQPHICKGFECNFKFNYLNGSPGGRCNLYSEYTNGTGNAYSWYGVLKK
ncbi:MAG: hypothetical protein ACI861_001243 [Paracoccaceae bacterium]|jgi:hypothetical protein